MDTKEEEKPKKRRGRPPKNKDKVTEEADKGASTLPWDLPEHEDLAPWEKETNGMGTS